jgi:hypothetical protein
MEAHATPYPVVLVNGEEECDLGCVGVSPMTTSRSFMQSLSSKCGLSSADISVVFVCRKQSEEGQQRMPINAQTQFGIILNQHPPTRERDAHFRVTPKRSKRERKSANSRSKKPSANPSFPASSTGNTSEASSDNDEPAEDPSFSNGSTAKPPPASSSQRTQSLKEAAEREREKIFGPKQATEKSAGRNARTPSAGAVASASNAPAAFPKPNAANSAPGRNAGGPAAHPQQPQHQPQLQPQSQPIPAAPQQPQPQVRRSRSAVPPTMQPSQPAMEGTPDPSQAHGQFQRVHLGPDPGRPCKVCNFCKENNTDVFHCCPNDKVVFGFRGNSPFGAVGTPPPGAM